MKRSCPSPNQGRPQTKRQRKWNLDELPKAVRELRDSLCAIYTNVRTLVEDSSTDEVRSLSMDEIYANLHVVSLEELSARVQQLNADKLGSSAGIEQLTHSLASAAKKLRKIKLANILKAKKSMRLAPGRETFRTIALSCAGGGKTLLFTKKGPYDWALGRIWQEMALVFALELRLPSVRQATCAAELLALRSHDIISDTDQSEICAYVKAHPERVCIILDGLDETKLDECSPYVQDVIAGKRLPGVRLVITSRHSTEAMNLIHNPEVVFHRRVELLGFEQQELEKYVHKVLPAEKACSLLDKLKRSPQLAAIMRTPLYATSICKLHSNQRDIPDTLGKIFNSMILNVIQPKTEKGLKKTEPHEKLSDVPDGIQESLLDLAKFAFHMLIRRKVVFTEADFTMFSLSSAARSLGLLIACDKPLSQAHPQWRFSHLALQEALASRYFASRSPNAADVAWLVQRLGAFTGSLNMFWRLLATELDSNSVNVLIEAILNAQSTSSTQPQDIDQHSTGAEGHNVTCFLFTTHDHIMEWADHVSSFLSLDEAEHLADELLAGRIDLVSASEMVRRRIDPAVTKITCQHFVRSLLAIWTDRVPSASTQILHDCLANEAQGSAIQCFTVTPTSKLPPVPPSDEAAQPFAALENANEGERRQRILYAFRVFAEHVNAKQSSIEDITSMQAIIKQYGVDFAMVPLTPSDCQAINAVMIHHHQFITDIYLDNCGIGDAGYACMADGMALLRNLTLIDLQVNNLTDRHTAHIAACIASNTSTLRQVYTSMNLFSSNAMATVHSNTHRCTGLLAVDFGGQKCTDPAVNLDVITTVCSSCPDVQYVDLNVCVLDMEGLTQLAPLLGALRLRVLQLYKVGMKQNSATIVSRIIQQQHESLQFLALRRNELTGDFLSTVRGELSQCRRLKKLYLDDDCLSSGALPVLASLLPSLPLLSSLRVARNDFRDADAEAKLFAAAVESCSSLKKLWMPERALVSPRLREALSAMARDDLNVQYVRGRWYDEVENDKEEDEYDDEGDSESEE